MALYKSVFNFNFISSSRQSPHAAQMVSVGAQGKTLFELVHRK